MAPSRSTVLPPGELNVPASGLGRGVLAPTTTPQAASGRPSADSFWMRLLRVSLTYTLPLESTATLEGSSNSPGSGPSQPHCASGCPVGDSTCMRWLVESATTTWPFESTATSDGAQNWPGAGPRVPHCASGCPVGESS